MSVIIYYEVPAAMCVQLPPSCFHFGVRKWASHTSQDRVAEASKLLAISKRIGEYLNRHVIANIEVNKDLGIQDTNNPP